MPSGFLRPRLLGSRWFRLVSALSVLDESIAQLEAGLTLARETTDSPQDSEVDAILESCRLSGAPLLPALRSLRASRHASELLRSEIAAELSGPKATARLVSWLPILVVAFAQLLGFEILQTLSSSILAQLSLVCGAALLVVANRWLKRLVRSAEPSSHDPAQELELLAARLRSGKPMKSCRSLLSNSTFVDSVTRTARQTGAPMVELLETRAQSIRQQHLARSREQVRQLSIRLTIPLGVAVLPALIFLLVVPMFLSLATPNQANF